jgi:hypothetical protein
MASVAGVSKNVMEKEANEYYDMDAEIHLKAKNDDGVTVKMGWDIYDGPFGAPTKYAGTQTENGATVAPSLIYGYVVAPIGDLSLKTGYVEAGPFGPAAFDTDASSFKMSAAYKINDMLTIALTDKQQTEGMGYSKNGGSLEGGEGDKSTYYIDAKIKASGWNVGLRSYTTTDTKNAASTTDTEKTAGTDIFVTGTVGGLMVAVENVGSKSDATGAKAKSGTYAHALIGLGNLTTGVAMVTMSKGQTGGTLFDPTVITDKALDATGGIFSSATKDTTVTVIPAIFKINDKMTLNAAFATGKVTDETFSEMDATISYALGKQTTISATYAKADGDIFKKALGTGTALDSASTDDANGISYMDYTVKVAF